MESVLMQPQRNDDGSAAQLFRDFAVRPLRGGDAIIPQNNAGNLGGGGFDNPTRVVTPSQSAMLVPRQQQGQGHAHHGTQGMFVTTPLLSQLFPLPEQDHQQQQRGAFASPPFPSADQTAQPSSSRSPARGRPPSAMPAQDHRTLNVITQALQNPALSSAAMLLLQSMTAFHGDDGGGNGNGVSSDRSAGHPLPSKRPRTNAAEPPPPPARETMITKKKKKDAATAAAAAETGSSLPLLGKKGIDFASLDHVVKEEAPDVADKNINDGDGNNCKRTQSVYQYRRVVASKLPEYPTPARSSSDHSSIRPSPKEHLYSLLSAQGYPTETPSSFDCGYHCKPTALQRASFGTRLLHATRSGDASTLSSLLECGLSRDPCNAHGDSLLQMACKRGDVGIVRCLLDAGAAVHTSDDSGRTPLHHAVWAGEACHFDIVESILDRDPMMLMVSDRVGRTPLDYVPRDQWDRWARFLDGIGDRYFPKGCAKDEGPMGGPKRIERGGQGGVADPEDALSVELAGQLASGIIGMEKVRSLGPKERKLSYICTTSQKPVRHPNGEQ